MELEEAINKRKSVRKYKGDPISKEEIEKLVEAGLKTPSAGGIHPLTIHITQDEETRMKLCAAAFNQDCIRNAKVILTIAVDFTRMVGRYHRRGYRFCFMEAGHAGQNISLMAASLGLGCVMVGAFRDREVKTILGIEQDPLYLIPIGRI